MERTSQALAAIHAAFADKVRKGSGVPYVAHLYSVMSIVAAYGGQDATRTAAVLHDIVEDTDWSAARVAAEFGDDVANIVNKVTEDKTLTWAARKAAVVERAETCCQGVAIVLMADKLDNLLSFIREEGEGEARDAYWAKFNAGREDQFDFYVKLVRALRGNPRLRGGDVEWSCLRTADLWLELKRALDVFELQ